MGNQSIQKIRCATSFAIASTVNTSPFIEGTKANINKLRRFIDAALSKLASLVFSTSSRSVNYSLTLWWTLSISRWSTHVIDVSVRWSYHEFGAAFVVSAADAFLSGFRSRCFLLNGCRLNFITFRGHFLRKSIVSSANNATVCGGYYLFINISENTSNLIN